jgi:hypothetical protein
MRARLSVLLIVVLTVFMSVILVMAEAGFDDLGVENDPTSNDRANACYEGGTLEGKCDSQLMWDAGWYLIRYEYGIFTRDDVPAWVRWIVPPEVLPEETTSSGGTSGGSACGAIYDTYQYGFFVNGVVAKGTMTYQTSDCATETYGAAWTDFVLAADASAALAKCQTVDSGYQSVGYYGPAYWCSTSAPPP